MSSNQFQEFRVAEKAKNSLIKHKKWITWIFRYLNRHNIVADYGVCAYGKVQIVDRVRKIGDGTVFWSKGCAGCTIGLDVIKAYQKTKIMPEIAHCALLQGALVTKDSINPGQLYKLPDRG